MVNHIHNRGHDAGAPRGFWAGLVAGLLIGGLAGAVAMLLLAPQSGRRTRAKLQRQSHEVRAQVADAVEEAVAQARDTGRQIHA